MIMETYLEKSVELMEDLHVNGDGQFRGAVVSAYLTLAR